MECVLEFVGYKNKQSYNIYNIYSIYYNIIYNSKILEITLMSINRNWLTNYSTSSQWNIMQLNKGIIKRTIMKQTNTSDS